MKRDRNDSPDSERREFLRESLVAGVGAATVMAVPGAAMAAPDPVDKAEPGSKQQGYRLSRHILDYYRTAAS